VTESFVSPTGRFASRTAILLRIRRLPGCCRESIRHAARAGAGTIARFSRARRSPRSPPASRGGPAAPRRPGSTHSAGTGCRRRVVVNRTGVCVREIRGPHRSSSHMLARSCPDASGPALTAGSNRDRIRQRFRPPREWQRTGHVQTHGSWPGERANERRDCGLDDPGQGSRCTYRESQRHEAPGRDLPMGALGAAPQPFSR